MSTSHQQNRDIKVPDGLADMLQHFCVAAIRECPANLVEYAANYFKNLAEKEKKSTVHFGETTEQRRESAEREEEHSDDGSESDDMLNEEEYQKMKMRIASGRRQSVAAESYDPEKDNEAVTLPVYPKTDEQRARLTQTVSSLLIFKKLDKDLVAKVINSIYEKKVTKNETIITQGADGDNFYVIESGEFEIIVNGEKIGGYSDHGFFGELALMYNCPRAATIVAKSEGVLWAMDRLTFRKIVVKSAFDRRQMYENYLKNVEIFGEMSSYERTNMADALDSRTYKDGDLILKQGEIGEEMFFVEKGCVSIKRRGRNSVADPVMAMQKLSMDDEHELKKVQEGDYFGEVSLLTERPRLASAYAMGETKLAVLDKGGFERLMGPCLHLLNRNMSKYYSVLFDIIGNEADDLVDQMKECSKSPSSPKKIYGTDTPSFNDDDAVVD